MIFDYKPPNFKIIRKKTKKIERKVREQEVNALSASARNRRQRRKRKVGRGRKKGQGEKKEENEK